MRLCKTEKNLQIHVALNVFSLDYLGGERVSESSMHLLKGISYQGTVVLA